METERKNKSTSTSSKIYARLIRFMDRWGVTRQQLADMLTISVKNLIRKMQGKIDWLVWECRRIAWFFGTTIAHLFEGEEVTCHGQ